MSRQKIVIYCRYSSDMQRADSCADQERAVRAVLMRHGYAADDIIVIKDEAESGTKTAREGFQLLRAMIARGEVAAVAVDDQSRLARDNNSFAFIQDLVFAGGRFLSTGEGIDTDVSGWELKVQVLQLHHGQTVRDLQHRVRRGQEGRVRADGSAGDFPYGYESFYLDPDWAAQLARRGPKPKKGVRVCEVEAGWVLQVFAWFVAGYSIGWIARELTRLGVPKGGRATTPGWHPQQVHRILTNAKYVGHWVWGMTTTVRDSGGRKKQAAVPRGQEVTRDRPDLRIVEQGVWDRAATRLAELGATFGTKDGQKRRGPKPNPADIYPRSPLGGILTCGACGAKLWLHHSNARRYYACPGAKKGLCGMTTQVPADRAEGALTAYLLDLLRGWPDWMGVLFRLTCDAVRAAADRVPAERERDARRADDLDRQIRNLVDALAAGGLSSPAVAARLREAEGEKAEVERRLAGYAAVGSAAVALPDEAWVAARLGEWAARAASAAGPESLLRLALASAAAEPVIAAGKKRGFVRLRVRVNAWGALAAAAGDSLPATVRHAPAAPADPGPEFSLDLGEPTAMDRWAPAIAEWRAAGVTWEEIVRRTGMDLNRVFVAWKRYTGASGDGPQAA
ncbi:recombinase family protein [Urbifossiella limnaea]|uniref:Recombinase n=1 Tax=Urbifossiella limnaea TaxID=2528023 RepID=A0A517XQF2_9BACT|nr:recombinase family protein [Urbifossiella limnaea]QDU19739.1 Recombinase [Urbifossiella limnaea]